MKNYNKDMYIEILEKVNLAEETLKTLLTHAMDEVAPKKEIRINVRTEPWINNEILELIYERDKTLIQSNNDKTNTELKKKPNKIQNRLTHLIRKTKANFSKNKVE